MNHSEIILMIQKLIINSGEFAYINGNNRSGKSLFLASLGNRYSHFQGSLRLNQELVTDKHYSTLIRLIHHDSVVFGDQGIMENIGFGLKSKIEANSDLINILSKFNLPLEKNIKCDRLSLSEQKCVELVRAYMQKPLMLLFDDLDIYFDSKLFDEIYALLTKMKKNGTIIIASGKKPLNSEKQYVIQNKRLELK